MSEAPHVPAEAARAVEALIFAADQPVPAARIGSAYAEVTGGEPLEEEHVQKAVDQLNAAYTAAGRAFRIHAWAGGYRMATEPALAPYVQALYAGDPSVRLSRSLMETLAVVAYRQPVTRPEIDFIRGVSADYAVRKLMEYGLIDVEGRSDALGRPLLYATTGRFLEQFGLAALDELPTLREIEELLDDPHFNRERAELLNLKRAAAQDETSQGEASDLNEDLDDAVPQPHVLSNAASETAPENGPENADDTESG